MFMLRYLNLEVLSLAAAVAVGTSAFAGGPKSPYGGSNNSTQSTSTKSSGWQTGGNMPKGQTSGYGGSNTSTTSTSMNPGNWQAGNNMPKGQTGGGYGGNPTGQTQNKQNGPWNNTPSTGKNGPWNQPSGQTSQSKYTPKNGNTGIVPPWMQKPQSGKGTIYSKTCGDPNYFKTCGVKTSYGYCYKGFDHCHWYCRSYSAKCGCWFFFDNGCNSWYYWCQPDACYYPVSYMPYQNYCCTTPTTCAAPTTYTVTTTTVVPVNTTCYASPAPYGNAAPMGNAGPYGGAAGGYGGTGPAMAQSGGPAGGTPMQLPPMPGE